MAEDEALAARVAAERAADVLAAVGAARPRRDAVAPADGGAHAAHDGAREQLRDEQASAVRVCNAFMDSVRMRESGVLRDGTYFCYLLHRRNVVKVGGEGKRMSHSVHVICGNGSGTDAEGGAEAVGGLSSSSDEDDKAQREVASMGDKAAAAGAAAGLGLYRRHHIERSKAAAAAPKKSNEEKAAEKLAEALSASSAHWGWSAAKPGSCMDVNLLGALTS